MANSDAPQGQSEIERVVDALRQLVDAVEEAPTVEAVEPLVPQLHTAQQLLNDVYGRVTKVYGAEAERHRRSAPEEHLRMAAPAWAKGEAALNEAQTHGNSAADALARAQHEDAIAQWYDEELSDSRFSEERRTD